MCLNCVLGNEENFKWDKVLILVQPIRLYFQGLGEVLMSSCHLLTLYTLALKESQNRSSYPDVLSTLVQCLEAVKPKYVDYYYCTLYINFIQNNIPNIRVVVRNKCIIY